MGVVPLEVIVNAPLTTALSLSPGYEPIALIVVVLLTAIGLE